MRVNSENNLIFEKYSKIYEQEGVMRNNQTRASIHIGFASHEDYKSYHYSNNPKDIEFCEYKTSSNAPVFITEGNDEELNIRNEGNTVEEIIARINAEEWGYDEPNHLNINPPSFKGLKTYVENTVADKDSSFVWTLFVNGKPVAISSDIDISNESNEFS